MRIRKALIPVALWAAVAASGCLDLNLLDDLREVDSGESGDTDPDTPAGPSSASRDATENGAAETGGEQSPGDGTATSPTVPPTDPGDKEPPQRGDPECGPLEQLVNQVCIATGPVSASLRFTTDEQAQVEPVVSQDPSVAVLSDAWEQQHHIVVSGLSSENATTVILSVADVNGNSDDLEVSVKAAGGPPVAITEILADPLGAEPDQEFVEIVNLGSTPIDLSGWMIDDGGDANGDLIGSGTTLEAGQAALLVASSYSMQAAEDPPPAEGALIIALTSSIGSNGLKNTEVETIELYDAAGSLVSQYLGQCGVPKEGCSCVRRRADLPDGDGEAFALESNGTSTPGTYPFL